MKERKNVTFQYKNINTRDLQIDQLYQRTIDSKRLMRIVKNFDPCLVNAPKISFRDGKYWVFDGQHTIVGCKTVNAKGNDINMMCKVFTGLTRLDEMELFIAQNGISAPVSSNTKLRAMYNFGDKDVVDMVKAASEAGVLVDFTNGRAANKCVAANTLMKIYLQMPREQFVAMLNVLRKSWDGIPDSFSNEMLKGMSLFYKTYANRFSVPMLIKSMSRITPIQIIREGKSYAGTAASYARIILRAFNNGRTTHRLPDEL